MGEGGESLRRESRLSALARRASPACASIGVALALGLVLQPLGIVAPRESEDTILRRTVGHLRLQHLQLHFQGVDAEFFLAFLGARPLGEIGRASCRERVSSPV